MLSRVKAWCFVFALIVLATMGNVAHGYRLESPAGKFVFSLELTDDAATYEIQHEGKTIVTPSVLGFRLQSDAVVGSGLSSLEASAVSNVDSTWQPLYGERSSIRDHYTSQMFTFESKQGLTVALEVRCYDSGVAFCYHVEPKDSATKTMIAEELTECAFPANHVTWTTKQAQGEYTKTRVQEMKETYARPQIFFDEGNQTYVAIGEARLVDFARMRLTASKNRDNTVVAKLSSPVKFTGSFKSPWRFIMAAASPGELLENNDLILNLNDPCAIAETSWIKPGKVLREVTLSTEGAFACIDYAAENGFAHMLFDAGWYGNEYDSSSDATTISIDRERSDGEIDMQKVIQYATEHEIGIIVYVNRRALEKQLDVILPLYKEWGISGVKYGFVNVGSQKWTIWLHDAVRKAADHQLMVDIHDEYRPTGFSRTYPNLMTQEGIGGDETAPTAKKTLGLLYPRSLAGASDHTFCYYSPRVAEKMNHAFQLGKSVCFYSPWQFLFWYDRPAASPPKMGGAGGADGVIGDEPELEFFADLPTVWDDMKSLESSMEEYAVIARRSGNCWYVGAMNADEPRKFEVKLDFLETEKQYQLRSYTHDNSVPTLTKVKIEESVVDANTVLQIDLQENDGAAYRLTPQ